MNNKYETEARSRWGNMVAYREHERKIKNYAKEKWAEANDGLTAIFVSLQRARIGVQVPILMKHSLLLPSFKHILLQLLHQHRWDPRRSGKMYVADERFKKNID